MGRSELQRPLLSWRGAGSRPEEGRAGDGRQARPDPRAGALATRGVSVPTAPRPVLDPGLLRSLNWELNIQHWQTRNQCIQRNSFYKRYF